MPFGRELWIEGEDFQEMPEKGFRRLFPGNMWRLKYGYIVECTGCDKDENGKVIAVHCNYLPDTKSGTPGADSVKVKGNLHWVSAAHAYPAEIRLYERLFKVPAPGARREGDAPDLERDFLDDMNTDSAPDDHRPARTLPAPMPGRKSASSSSVTVTSWPTALIRSRAPGIQSGRHAEGLLGQGGLRQWLADGVARTRSMITAPRSITCPCDPGMKGCELYGRFRFANESKNERYWRRRNGRSGKPRLDRRLPTKTAIPTK